MAEPFSDVVAGHPNRSEKRLVFRHKCHRSPPERNLYNLLETLIAAKNTKNRLGHLEDANRRAG